MAKNATPENIDSERPGIPCWDSADVAKSLEAILIYVENEAAKTINWYWTHKQPKARLSQFIRFAAFTLTALGGLFPIAVLMLNPFLKSLGVRYQIPESGLVASLFVGIAAALYGLDKAFGYSSGWTRYVLTATILEKTLGEFRIQWMLLMAKISPEPAPEQIHDLLKCAQDFRAAIAGAVLQETKDWVTEFQNNLVELERDTRAQLETLRTKVEKSVAVKAEESRTGAIELHLTDADHADGFHYDVALEGDSGIAAKETVANTKTWVATGIAPGQYRLTLTAKVAGQERAVRKVVIVKPVEVTGIEAKLQS
jgi:SMODS and SLOG-associating 2TM effector domain 2